MNKIIARLHLNNTFKIPEGYRISFFQQKFEIVKLRPDFSCLE